MLARIKADTEELLKLAFENYYLLSSAGRKGILDGACSPPPGHIEFPPMALVAGVRLFETMRDVFHPSDVEWLADRFRIAAKSRWNRLANLCDDGLQLVGALALPGGLQHVLDTPGLEAVPGLSTQLDAGPEGPANPISTSTHTC